ISSWGSAQIGPGKRTLAEISAYLLAKLASIIGPLTKLDTEIRVPIPTNNVYPVDLSKTIHDDKSDATIDVKATKTQVSVSIAQKALLIDTDGLHVLVHVNSRV